MTQENYLKSQHGFLKTNLQKFHNCKVDIFFLTKKQRTLSESVATVPVRSILKNLGDIFHDRLLVVVGVEGEDVERVHVVH